MIKKLLQITNRVPYPPYDGGAIGMYNFIKSYHECDIDLTVLCLNTKKHHVEPTQLPEDDFLKFADFHFVEADASVVPADAFKNLFSSKSYNIERFDVIEAHQKISEICNEKSFDLIHLDSPFTGPYLSTLRQYSGAKIIMRAHNVEYLIWERLAKKASSPKKWYLKLLARRLKKYEAKIINEVDALIPISEFDAEKFRELGCNKPMIVTPAGVDPDRFEEDESQLKFPSIFHLGSLDWLPNREALNWFVNDIWPKLREKHPSLIFSIAGRNMPDSLKEWEEKGIKVLGEVDDAAAFMNEHAVMVVPLISGSGMRLKILEGMALGKCIVSTSIGAEGIEVEHDKHLKIADTSNSFFEAIEEVINSRELCQELGEEAKKLAHDKYSNKSIVKKMIRSIREELNL